MRFLDTQTLYNLNIDYGGCFMQQGNLNVNWNTNSSFLVYIQNDDIFSYDGQKIGVVNKKYNEVEQGLIKCKEKLIELGVIKVPKTLALKHISKWL